MTPRALAWESECSSDRGGGMMTAEQQIRVDDIIPGDNNREAFDATGLQELADSIAQYGAAATMSS